MKHLIGLILILSACPSLGALSFVTQDQCINLNLVKMLHQKFQNENEALRAPQNISATDDIADVFEKYANSLWKRFDFSRKIQHDQTTTYHSSSSEPNESNFNVKVQTLEAKATIAYQGALSARLVVNAPTQEMDFEVSTSLNSEIMVVYNHNSDFHSNSDNIGLRWNF